MEPTSQKPAAPECKKEAVGPAEFREAIPDFGNAERVDELIELIGRRTGVGDLLAEGSCRLAAYLGEGAGKYAMHVKGQELPPIEPRTQTNLALGYAVSPVGPGLDICEHDWDFDDRVGWPHTLEYSRTLGILERIPMNELSVRKVRNFKALSTLWSRHAAYQGNERGRAGRARRRGNRVGDLRLGAHETRRAAVPLAARVPTCAKSSPHWTTPFQPGFSRRPLTLVGSPGRGWTGTYLRT